MNSSPDTSMPTTIRATPRPLPAPRSPLIRLRPFFRIPNGLTAFLLSAVLALPLTANEAEEAEEFPPTAPIPRIVPPPETVIEGDQLEMIATDDAAYFIFTDNIRVTGNNITMTCDRLEVVSARDEDDPPGTERLSGMGRIRVIIASGRVHVWQEGREATAGRAEVLPDEGQVILTESPVIRDEQGEVSGERIILYQGLERAVVESGPAHRARVVLPNIPDLGFPRGQQDSESSE
jgi:lipopolysaccharide export system protein LptA